MSKKVGIGYSFSKEKEIEELKAKIAKLETENKKAETSKKAENKKAKAE